MLFYDSSDDDEPSYKSRSSISVRDRRECERNYSYGNRDEYVSSTSKVAFEKYAEVSIANEISFGLKNEFMQRDIYKDLYGKSSITFESQSDIKFSCQQQPLNFTSYEPKRLNWIVDSGCVLNKRYDDEYLIAMNPKFEATARKKFECEDKDGSIASMELNNAKTGVNGDKIDAKISSTFFEARDENEDVELKFITTSAQAKYGVDENGIDEMIKLGVNLVEAEFKGVKSTIGLNIDTGVSIRKNVVEAKIDGFGIKVGKEVGISTPIGEVSVDLGK
ncbi:21600_t:CDS:2, partial [Gigaspora rosea]